MALYSTFSVVGFFSGSIVNMIGVKTALVFGGTGYFLYAIALLVSVHSTNSGGFTIFAGAYLGVCAGLLWTAQGTIMISYPVEGSKGRFFAWFWAIFNLGGVMGALVRFTLIFRQTGSPSRNCLLCGAGHCKFATSKYLASRPCYYRAGESPKLRSLLTLSDSAGPKHPCDDG